jgi:hypothetical protein
MAMAMQRNPQHFHCLCTDSVPLRTSHPHVCAQRETALLSGLEGGSGPAPVLVPAQPTGCRDLARAWLRSPEESGYG